MRPIDPRTGIDVCAECLRHDPIKYKNERKVAVQVREEPAGYLAAHAAVLRKAMRKQDGLQASFPYIKSGTRTSAESGGLPSGAFRHVSPLPCSRLRAPTEQGTY